MGLTRNKPLFLESARSPLVLEIDPVEVTRSSQFGSRFYLRERNMAKSATKNRRPVLAKPAMVAEPSNDHEETENGARLSGAKNRQALAIKETEVLMAVAGLNLDSVSSNIAATQVEVQKSLADLSAKLVERLDVLRNVEEAIALKKDELKQLYDLEAAEIELDDLKAQIEAQRESWEEEQARKQREFAEMQSDRNKQWARSDEEYQYKLGQDHKKAEDSFKGFMEEQAKTNRNKQEQLDKGWAEREAELKKRETELAELKAKVEAIPETIRKAENAAVAVATNSVKKEYETKATLANKDLETFQKTGGAGDGVAAAGAGEGQRSDHRHQDPAGAGAPRRQGDLGQGAGERQRPHRDGGAAEGAGEGTEHEARQVSRKREERSRRRGDRLPAPAASFVESLKVVVRGERMHSALLLRIGAGLSRLTNESPLPAGFHVSRLEFHRPRTGRPSGAGAWSAALSRPHRTGPRRRFAATRPARPDGRRRRTEAHRPATGPPARSTSAAARCAGWPAAS